MELYEYWRLLIRHLPLLIVASLIGLGGASYVNFVTDPEYSASADVFVTTPSTTIDIGALATGSNFSEQRVVSYAQIISGPATLGPVIEKLDLGVTTSELAQDINAFAPDGTVLIRIDVTGKDPNKVAAIANAVAEQFEQTVQYLEATSASTSTNIKVTPVRQALPNYTPTSPNKLLNSILGVILGFALGSGLVILRIFFDRTVKNEDHLGEIPLLGTILYDPTARDTPLLTQVSPYSGRAEAFRHIRTNLQFLGDAQDRKVFAMTSALPNEGKTTTIINLALSLSSAGLRVLLIDADLRRPQLNLFLEIPANKEGVTEILSQAQQLKKLKTDPAGMTVQPSPTFDVLCSGSIPSQPAELLGSESFTEMIDACRKVYDVVLLDCPPTLPITDAAVIATSVDAVILVVKAGKTSIKQFRGTIESLVKVDATILGCVINMIPSSRRSEEYGYRYGYRGYRAYYSYGDGSKSKSLYSPVEPYGPDLNGREIDAKPEEQDTYTEYDGLQELREHAEATNISWRKLFDRTFGLLILRLSRELENQSPEESRLVDSDQDTRAPKKVTSGVIDWLRSRNSGDGSLTNTSTTPLELEVEREILEWSSNYAGKKARPAVKKSPVKSSKSRTTGSAKAKSKKSASKSSASKKTLKR
jgi:succinoglycan biosynthesis transport protein ExoP